MSHQLSEFFVIMILNFLLIRAVDSPIDLIHANDLSTLFAAVALRKRHGAKLIYDSHEIYPDQVPNGSSFVSGLWRLTEGYLIHNASSVITVNPSIARELQSRHRLQILPSVVMNCTQLHPKPISVEGPCDEVHLLYHGGLLPGRGLEQLVASVALMDSRAVLFIRGAGPLQALLKAEAQALGVADRVRFLDPVPPDQVVSAMRGFSIGVMPYLPTSLNNYYCSPNKIFEFLMGGLAVVASDLPEVRRIVEEHAAGVLFPPFGDEGIASAVNHLITDPQRLHACQVAAYRAAVEYYNWDIQKVELLRVYAYNSVDQLEELPAADPR